MVACILLRYAVDCELPREVNRTDRERTPIMFTATVTGEVTEIHPDTVTTDAGPMGDDILRSLAAIERTATVKASGRRVFGANQSHSSRAWSGGGEVD